MTAAFAVVAFELRALGALVVRAFRFYLAHRDEVRAAIDTAADVLAPPKAGLSPFEPPITGR